MKLLSSCGRSAFARSAVLLGAVFVLASGAAHAAGAKYALLVGINDYPRFGADNALHGCVNDVVSMSRALVDNGGFDPKNIRIVTAPRVMPAPVVGASVAPELPTRDAIVKEFRAWLRDNARAHPDGTFLFYYSGHGGTTRQPPRQGGWKLATDPTATTNQTMCLYDFDLVDDDLHTLLSELRGVPNFSGQVTTILDSCHSGTATRGDEPRRQRTPRPGYQPRLLPPLSFDGPMPRGAGANAGNRSVEAGTLAAFAGCQPTETSQEEERPRAAYVPKNESHGALTYFLLQAFHDATSATTNAEIYQNAVTALNGSRVDQSPMLETETPNAPFLGGATRSVVPPVPYTLAGNEVRFELGVPRGALRGGFVSVLDDSQRKQAELPIVRATLSESSALVPQGTRLAPKGLVKLLTPYFSAESLRVAVSSEIPTDAPIVTRLKNGFADSRLVTIVPTPGAGATGESAPNVWLQRSTRREAQPNDPRNATKGDQIGYFFSTSRSGGPAIFHAFFPMQDNGDVAPDASRDFLAVPDNFAAQTNLLALSNREAQGMSLQEAVTLKSFIACGTLEKLANGRSVFKPDAATRRELNLDKDRLAPSSETERLAFEVTNNTGRKLYVALLWLGQDGSITLIPNKQGEQVFTLSSDDDTRTKQSAFLKVTGPQNRDTLKMFVSTSPINPRFFVRDKISEKDRGPANPFDILTGQAMGTRGVEVGGEQPTFDSWDARSFPLSIGGA